MSLHSDLLEQAEHLLRADPRRPRQANLRRAASTAYYAVFHFLAGEASAMLISGAQPWQMKLRHLIRRTFDHGKMKKASTAFSSGGTLKADWRRVVDEMTRGVGIDLDLQTVAEAFTDLQEARHLADYDLSLNLERTTVEHWIQQASDAIDAWDRVKDRPEAKAYLASLLLYEGRNR